MLKQRKTGRVKRIIMPMALLSPSWPVIPLVSKVRISLGISDLLLIAMRSGHAKALCPHQSFLSQMLTASASRQHPCQLLRLAGLDVFRQSVQQVLIAFY